MMICWSFRDPGQCTWKLGISLGKHLTLTSHVWQEPSMALLSYWENRNSQGSLSADYSSPAPQLGVQAGLQSLSTERLVRASSILGTGMFPEQRLLTGVKVKVWLSTLGFQGNKLETGCLKWCSKASSRVHPKMWGEMCSSNLPG